MKKPVRSAYGSAAYVVAHAKWQRSRGRRPSESYSDARNPAKALVLASRDLRLGTLQVKGLKARAVDHLDTLRNSGTTQPEAYITAIRLALKHCGRTLADMGTSESEIRALQVKGLKARAVDHLDTLRNSGTTQPEVYIDGMRQALKDGGLTLANIGTSEPEIQTLQVKGLKARAVDHLDTLRNSGTTHPGVYISAMREALKDAGLTLADIGANEEEIGQPTVSAYE